MAQNAGVKAPIKKTVGKKNSTVPTSLKINPAKVDEHLKKAHETGVFTYKVDQEKQLKGAEIKKDAAYFSHQRKNNLQTFKDNVSQNIIDLEVNHSRINIEEKLAECGNIGYITEQDVEVHHITHSKISKEIDNILQLAALACAAALIVQIYYLVKHKRKFFIV